MFVRFQSFASARGEYASSEAASPSIASRVWRSAVAAALAVSLVLLAGCASPEASSSSANDEASSGAAQEASVTVQVVVDSSAVEGAPVSADTSVTLTEGQTAYDALVATGLPVNVTESPYGAYVSSVDGLAEREHGDMSGWMYEVNGAMGEVSASSYVVKEGDTVRWYYSV